MARARVLFAATTLVVGGAERILRDLILRFDRRRFEVSLLTLRDPGDVGLEIAAAGIPVESGWTGKHRFDPFLIPRLRARIRSQRIDAIYFLDHPHAVFHLGLASLGTGVRARVMPVHTTGRWGGRPSVPRSVRLFLPRLDRVIAIAETQREYLQRVEGIPGSKLALIRNGIELRSPAQEKLAAERARLRAELGIDPDARVAMILAVLRPEKNHELLFEVLARLSCGMPDLRLVVLGDGPRRGFLEDRARALGVETRVLFLGHRGNGREIWPAADVAVLCSHPLVETLPLSLLEAMDAALPIVATDVGAMREIVIPGENGEIVPPGSAEGLASALKLLLDDPATAMRYGRRSQAIVRAEFGVERMVAETEDLLIRLLETNARP